MKMRRFTAASNQKAMFKIHESLGPDALIYSTRSTERGVEMLAGLPDEVEGEDDPVQSDQFHTLGRDLMLKLDEKIALIDQNMKQLTQHLEHNTRLVEALQASKQNELAKRVTGITLMDNFYISLQICMDGVRHQFKQVGRVMKTLRLGRYERKTA